MPNAAIRPTPLVLRQLRGKACSSRWACRCLGALAFRPLDLNFPGVWRPTTHPATAIKLFDRALVLSSGDIFTLWCSVLALSWLGDTETAIERAQRAPQLSPFDPQKFLAYNALAIPYVQTQRYGEAHDAARRSVQLNHA
jgi:tetratricopeptide (TPR) repeat protein